MAPQSVFIFVYQLVINTSPILGEFEWAKTRDMRSLPVLRCANIFQVQLKKE
jgi:hypothetical protein